MIKEEHLIDVIICREKDSILEVSRILRDTQRRHLIVLDKNDIPKGIISTIDLNNRVIAEEKNPKQTKARDIMTKNIKTLPIESSYEEAYKIMSELGTYSIPITKGNKLLGLLEFTVAFKLKQNKGVN